MDAVGRLELDSSAVERARRHRRRRGRTRARTRPATPYPAPRRGLGGGSAAAAQLPRRALEQQPPAQRDRRLAGRRRQQPVQVVAREVRAPRQRGAVGARLVERAQHDVDQLAQAVRHPRHLDRFRRLAGRRPPRAPPCAPWPPGPTSSRGARARRDACASASTPTSTRRSPRSARDGSPRISGTETQFNDGELWIGSMWKARKALDLQRDPRFALHSGSRRPAKDWQGDAKVAGVAEEITDPERDPASQRRGPGGPSHLFRLDLREVSTVGLNEARDEAVIEVWTPERRRAADRAGVSERLRAHRRRARPRSPASACSRSAAATASPRPTCASGRREAVGDRPLAEDDRRGRAAQRALRATPSSCRRARGRSTSASAASTRSSRSASASSIASRRGPARWPSAGWRPAADCTWCSTDR